MKSIARAARSGERKGAESRSQEPEVMSQKRETNAGAGGQGQGAREERYQVLGAGC